MTNVTSKGPSATRVPASLLAFLAFGLALSGCVSRGEIKAFIWTNDGLPKELCEKYPELWQYGVARKLNAGGEEYMPYCDSNITQWLSMHEKDFNDILDRTLPKEPTP